MKTRTLHRLSELVRDWDYLILHLGFFRALPRVGLEISQLPFRHIRYLLFVKPFDEPFPVIRSEISLEIRPFRFSDLGLVRRINRPSEANLCARRLAAGHVGLMAFHNGQPAGYAWGCGAIDPGIARVLVQSSLREMCFAWMPLLLRIFATEESRPHSRWPVSACSVNKDFLEPYPY